MAGEFDALLADLNEVRRTRDMATAIGAPISATEARQKLDVAVRDGAPTHEVSKTEAMILPSSAVVRCWRSPMVPRHSEKSPGPAPGTISRPRRSNSERIYLCLDTRAESR
jgi:hypothetical protein